ncbi:40706_t:CDS:2 [Gigaspora margarita]|uniref:40706_t:CDS:1 n=1 Tax=Gigaspora margarita TaxID=4874 RepID=A0ABN7UG99_GIGMA|nr:40706_t:CDS:2 [Gigaspora margarita]
MPEFIKVMIFCLVQGDAFENSFPVDIDDTMTIGHLRDAIKEKSALDIPANKLKLWKVNIPQSKENQKTIIPVEINIKEQLKGEELASFEFIKDHFNESSRHIRVIVELPVAIEKRKTKNLDEENENLSPKSIAEFLDKQEGIKNNFAKPHELCMNEFNFERKGRDDTIHQTYDYIFDRYCKIRKQLSENRDIGDKKLYPLPALQSTPGGGKSFFLDELASFKSKDLDRYLKIKLADLEKEPGSGEKQQYAKDIVNLLYNSVGICITYNGNSPYGNYIDGDLRRGLVMRILWSYFFDGNKLDWNAFCKKFRNHFDSLDTLTAIKSIIYHSGKSVLLCVDETMRVLSGNNTNLESIKTLLSELYTPYHALSASESKFHFVVSTLDAINMWKTQTDSQRPINWIPLRRLALSESVELFHEITKSLSERRLFIIKKCIADCNGHPRTLEEFYQLLNDDIALNTDVYSSLIERLAKNLGSLFGRISFSIVKMALLGKITSLICEIETTLGTLTLRELISSGIYINSLTDKNETFNVIPTLSPVSLQYFCMFNKNDVNDDAKTVAKILRDLLTTEYSFDDEVMDGKPFERFHANWELLYRALRDERKEMSLYEIYGLEHIDQPKIELGRKIGIVKVENVEFPPSDEIYDIEGKPIENFVNCVLVPTKTNNCGFDMVIFERKFNDTGYISINIECKFSYPGRMTKLTTNEIKEKYKHTKNKYFNHVRYEIQKTRNSIVSWETGSFYDRSTIGKLKMAINDIYLVFVVWRDMEPLDDEIKNNKNIIIVTRENLKKIYTPSLVARPLFYNDILKQIKQI